MENKFEQPPPFNRYELEFIDKRKLLYYCPHQILMVHRKMIQKITRKQFVSILKIVDPTNENYMEL